MNIIPASKKIVIMICIFFLNDTATTEIYTPLYTLSLHDALPIYEFLGGPHADQHRGHRRVGKRKRSEEHTSELQSHSGISYAVFCLKKKKSFNFKEVKIEAESNKNSRIISTSTNKFQYIFPLQYYHSSKNIFFFFIDTATTEIYTPLYTLSLHDALPISCSGNSSRLRRGRRHRSLFRRHHRSEEHTSELQSHSGISYAVFCLKKKKK